MIKWPALEGWLSARDDSVTIVNFWATWCGPCLAEMPDLIATRRAWQGRPIRWLFVSLDFAAERHSRLEPLLDRRQYRLPVALLDEPDGNAWIPAISAQWQGNLPATLVLGGQGDDTLIDRTLEPGELDRWLASRLPGQVPSGN